MSNTSEPAIIVRNVSKKYRLFQSARDRLKEALHPFSKRYHKEFWALQGISFEVQRGQTVGILGQNGSGKSTLLQIITGIMQPTTGEVIVNGRISALLELGAGFNPDFTGRENAVFQAEVMGLSREEIDLKLPEIEDFADIGEFFEQPVKVYSSGMFVRLAFATAINVNPDILIVDEALAVGDAKFQHKCFNKFKNFQDEGKTILFVTHDTGSITKYCSKAVLLQDGCVVDVGEPLNIAKLYTDLLFVGKIEGYSAHPKLLESKYHGFNIIHFQKRYFGVSISLGEIDISQIDEERLDKYAKDKKFIFGKSLEEVRRHIDDAVLCNNDLPPGRILGMLVQRKKTDLEVFLEENYEEDNCVNRKSYNKNEYRLGNKKAIIIDYLLSADEKEEIVHVLSGSKVHLYLKSLFHGEIQHPNYGFAIKTLDGVLVYGTHTSLMNLDISSVNNRLISVVKFTFTLPLNKGDYFFDVGVGNTFNEALDWRGDLIHIVVHGFPAYTHTGLVDCKTTFTKLADM